MTYYKDLSPTVDPSHLLKTYKTHGTSSQEETNQLADLIGHMTYGTIYSCFAAGEDLTCQMLSQVWGGYRASKTYLEYCLDSRQVFSFRDYEVLAEDNKAITESHLRLRAELAQARQDLASLVSEYKEYCELSELQTMRLKAELYDLTMN